MSNQHQTIILFHDNCLDGYGAALAAWMRFGGDAQYIPVQHNTKFPIPVVDLLDANVFILDFSYSLEHLLAIADCVNQLVVLDHHKTFGEVLSDEEALKQIADAGNISWIFDTSRSGAVITWEYFHPSALGVPRLLLHIQDRDLWQFKLAGTKEICAALGNEKLVERSFDWWKFLLEAYDSDDREVMHDIYAKGRAVIATQEALISECIKNSTLTADESMVLCNAPASLASEIGNRLAKQHGKMALVFSYDGNSHQFKCSLRSIGEGEDADCTVVAKQHGGGGHFNAAGFTVSGTGMWVNWL